MVVTIHLRKSVALIMVSGRTPLLTTKNLIRLPILPSRKGWPSAFTKIVLFGLWSSVTIGLTLSIKTSMRYATSGSMARGAGPSSSRLCFPTSMIFFCVVSCHFARLCSSKVALVKALRREPTALIHSIIRRSQAAQYSAAVTSLSASADVNACRHFKAGSEFIMASTSAIVSMLSHSLRYFSQLSFDVSLVTVLLHPFRSLYRSDRASLVTGSIFGRCDLVPFLVTYSRNVCKLPR